MNTIKIVVENDYSYLDGSVSKEVFDEIRQSISYYSPGYQFSPRYNTFKNGKRVWDGKISLYKKMKGKWRFPTGMASYAVKVLENNGLEWKLDDRRNHVEKNLNLSLAEYFVKDGKKIKVTATIEIKTNGDNLPLYSFRINKDRYMDGIIVSTGKKRSIPT